MVVGDPYDRQCDATVKITAVPNDVGSCEGDEPS